MKKCIFCNSTQEITKEHIFSKRFRKLNKIKVENLSHVSPKLPYKGFVAKKDINRIKLELKSQRNYSVYSLVNGSVCKKCNKDFLGKIDLDIENTLTILMGDENLNRNISKTEWQQFALWVYKTILTLVHPKTINFKKIIPKEVYEDFYFTRKIPDDIVISVAKLKDFVRFEGPLWEIGQDFILTFSPRSRIANNLQFEERYIINRGNLPISEDVLFLQQQLKGCFHIVLNLNGILVRIAYIPSTEIFKYNFQNKEFGSTYIQISYYQLFQRIYI